MSECNSDCSSCAHASGCPSQKGESMLEATHEFNSIHHVIGVVSGKGGVGKSMVSAALAVMLRRKGYKVGILDADITGPSIPRMFGITKKAMGTEDGVLPQKSHNDISVMSINLLLEDDEAPVVWRGPIIAGTVKQFWTDVIWGELDYLIVDMPPGTGDVPLTVFQSIPVNGIVVVTTPQDLVSMIVKKAYNMAQMMKIPVLGIVENMSYIECPDCGKKISLFGEGKTEKVAQQTGAPLLAKVPLNPQISALCDAGDVEKIVSDDLQQAAQRIEEMLKEK